MFHEEWCAKNTKAEISPPACHHNQSDFDASQVLLSNVMTTAPFAEGQFIISMKGEKKKKAKGTTYRQLFLR